MEHCSRYWGNGEGCYGVVWREDNKCWIRDSNTTVSGVVASTDGTHSALVASNTYEKIDPSCPDTDLSTHTLGGLPGLGYTLNATKSSVASIHAGLAIRSHAGTHNTSRVHSLASTTPRPWKNACGLAPTSLRCAKACPGIPTTALGLPIAGRKQVGLTTRSRHRPPKTESYIR
jgi:hypothetical protein